jgi:uncharacterized protein YjiS (DUF1127 family)
MGLAVATEDLRHFTSRPAPGGWFLRHLLLVEAWLDARESRLALYRLDDRALADIGLTQADLERVDAAASWQSLLLPSSRK